MLVDEKPAAHWTTQAFGLALISAALLILTIVGLILFGAEDAAFIGLPAVVAVVVTVVVWRFDNAWALSLGVLATLGAMVTMFWLAFGLFQVFSPIEFIVGLVFLLGVVLSFVGGIMALFSRKKGDTGPTKRETRVRRGTMGLIGVAAVVSIVGFLFTRESVSEAEASGATTLEMANFEFDPSTSSMPSGGNLLVANSDAFAHDFTLEELGIYVYFGPGSEALVDLSGAAPGTYPYFCSLHSDGTEGMRDTVIIES
jgi:plastocyanin